MALLHPGDEMIVCGAGNIIIAGAHIVLTVRTKSRVLLNSLYPV